MLHVVCSVAYLQECVLVHSLDGWCWWVTLCCLLARVCACALPCMLASSYDCRRRGTLSMMTCCWAPGCPLRAAVLLDVFHWVDVPACRNVCSRASLLARWPVGFTQLLSVVHDAVLHSVYGCRRRYPCSMGL